MNRLSLLTRSSLQATASLASLSGHPIEAKHPAPEEVTAWECGVCGDLHKWEDDAHDCCAPAALKGCHDQEDAVRCPVCGGANPDHRHAADCCLWHDLDAPTRWRIADAVEAGDATWADAIAKETTA
jgi:hypothetical protein